MIPFIKEKKNPQAKECSPKEREVAGTRSKWLKEPGAVRRWHRVQLNKSLQDVVLPPKQGAGVA